MEADSLANALFETYRRALNDAPYCVPAGAFAPGVGRFYAMDDVSWSARALRWRPRRVAGETCFRAVGR